MDPRNGHADWYGSMYRALEKVNGVAGLNTGSDARYPD